MEADKSVFSLRFHYTTSLHLATHQHNKNPSQGLKNGGGTEIRTPDTAGMNRML